MSSYNETKEYERIYTPIQNSHTGIKLVHNLESDQYMQPKPCFRCYLADGSCNQCFDRIRSANDQTYCSWEQFKINADWKYFPDKKCPESAVEFIEQTWKKSVIDPEMTLEDYMNMRKIRESQSIFPMKFGICDKDRHERAKYNKQRHSFDRNWEEKEISLIPVPWKKRQRSLTLGGILSSII